MAELSVLALAQNWLDVSSAETRALEGELLRRLGLAVSSVDSGGIITFAVAPLFPSYVEAVTDTKAPTSNETGDIYTNEGDSDGATVTLPTAAAGLWYTCYVQTAQTLTVTAADGDTIRLGDSVTAAAGSITSAVVGSAVTLRAINATEWVSVATVGSWSF